MKNSLSIALLFMAQFVSAQTTIGWDASCDYDMNANPNSLQQAIDDGMTNIRLTNENSFVTNIEITDNVSIKGGFENCSDAASDNLGFSNTVIDGSTITFPVIRMKFIDDADMLFDHLTLKNGGGTNNNGVLFQWAGGIGIRDVRGNLTINHSILETSDAHVGGGMVINNTSLRSPSPFNVLFSNSLIRQNTVDGDGGGIYCSQSTVIGDEVAIILNQGSSIRDNHSGNNGGGIANVNCHIEFHSGISSQTGNNANFELYNNSSNRSGGGIHTMGGTIEFIGNQTMPFDIYQNQSASDDNNSGQGGGVAASGAKSTVNLTNTNISSNITNRYGAGLYAAFDAIINLTSTKNCSYSRYCSSISHNLLLNTFPGGGSAAAAQFNGKINIANAWITRNNSDNQAYIGYVSNGGSILFEGNVINNNGLDMTYLNGNAFNAKNETAQITLAYNTLFNNSTFSTIFDLGFDSFLELFGNIIKESGTIISTQTGVVVDITCNMFNDVSSISVPMTDTVIDTVDFLNAPNADYRLANTDTTAMDVCDNLIYQPNTDMDGEVRGIDNGDVPNTNGPYDLGAYEFKDIDLIFIDSFE